MSLIQIEQNRVKRYRDESAPTLTQYANNKRLAGHFNDVTVQAGNESIPANRMVLSCYSEFFETMFLTEFREQYQNRVEIRQDGKAVRTIINYMYTGCIDIDNDNAASLLATADFLQMEDVKRFCFDFLEAASSVDNCIDIYKLSTLYRNPSHMEKIYHLISNNFDEISSSGKFNQISKDDFLNLITKFDTSIVQQSSIYKAIISWVRQDTNRKNDFPVLFLSLNLDKIPVQFLEKVVAKDQMVQKSHWCLNAVMSSIFKKLEVSRSSTSNPTSEIKPSASEDYKSTRNSACVPRKEFMILRIGGREKKVSQIFNASVTKTKFPDLPYDLSGHCAVVLHGCVYCIGGKEGAWFPNICNNVYRMNLKEANLRWEQVESMSEKRYSFGAAIFGNNFVAAGGSVGDDSTNSVELYESQRGEWKFISPMHQRKMGHALVNAGGSLFAIGGFCNSEKFSAVERLDDVEGEWKFVQSMHTARGKLAAVSCGGFIYAIGGSSNNHLSEKSVEKYDLANDQWSFVKDMIVGRQQPAACVFHGKIFVAGGSNFKARSAIDNFDPAVGQWSKVDLGQGVERMEEHAVVAM